MKTKEKQSEKRLLKLEIARLETNIAKTTAWLTKNICSPRFQEVNSHKNSMLLKIKTKRERLTNIGTQKKPLPKIFNIPLNIRQ